ncbi:MAG TPA: hypothetical protein VF756_28480 [Thermoanaerobaculia bacterium]
MGSFSTEGKHALADTVARKLGLSTETLVKFHRRNKERFANKRDAVYQIRQHFEKGDIEGAKRALCAGIAPKLGTSPDTVYEFMGRMKKWGQTKLSGHFGSFKRFKDSVRPHFRASQ